jgi:hypothetical protein
MNGHCVSWPRAVSLVNEHDVSSLPMTRLRTLLVLGRVSTLPTVWSNCLAGWWLSGGGSWERFAMICLGATCLYVGGMYLNDAFDAQFDQQHRPERPIPPARFARPTFGPGDSGGSSQDWHASPVECGDDSFALLLAFTILFAMPFTRSSPSRQC